MRFQLSIIIIVLMICVITTKSTSKYGGVSWNEKRNLWQAEFYINGNKRKSYFANEFDAAKTVNKLCEKTELPQHKPEIYETTNQLANKKTSQHKGVYWHQKIGKWYVQIHMKGQKRNYGGTFIDELDAAKRVNQICEELGIPFQNPNISAMPNHKYQAKEKTSQYKGVTYHKKTGKWQTLVSFKGQQQKYGGRFNDELDAAKRVNEVCEDLGIPPQNPKISTTPIEPYQKKEKTSQYKGVHWETRRKRWKVELKLEDGKSKFGGVFVNKLDAGKRVNQLCEELGIPPQNPKISAIPNEKYQAKAKKSQYKGVSYHEETGKWIARVSLKGKKQKYGGIFNEELDAAKRVNELCEDFEIPKQNPAISTTPNLNEPYQKKEKTSQYKGVYWQRKNKKWRVQVCTKGTSKFGGYFEDELDARERVNQLCEELRIPPKKTSHYKGVFWHSKNGKWCAFITPKGKKQKYGGMFKYELDAAKRVNQLCEEMEILSQNPEISATPNQIYQKKEKTSQYKGVCWYRTRNKWRAEVRLKGKKIFGGYFNNEWDAAKKVNQLCEEFGISIQNPSLLQIPTQQSPGKCNILFDYHAIQDEFKYFIKILDENNHTAIKDIVTNAMRSREKAVMTEINLRTKNGESALSIAAQHGLFNVVKFLISKGANKEHFTNEYHTPLSLAVSQNHFKVVQVLLDNWISPNSHEEPYLHLSPIFNVKSREIAQLLVDNDAVTSCLYNNQNQSPLTVACQNGFLDVAQFFLDDGLDINHSDNDNKTPLFYARTNGHHSVVNLLISNGAKE